MIPDLVQVVILEATTTEGIEMIAVGALQDPGTDIGIWKNM